MVDRGRIAAGQRADLVLVEGNPLEDITATRAIVGVWKNGHAVARSMAEVEHDAPAAHAATRLSDFDGDAIDMASGGSWADTSDTMMGGASESNHRLVVGGAAGSRGALEIAARAISDPKRGLLVCRQEGAFAPGIQPPAKYPH